jgi:hypothetical protein
VKACAAGTEVHTDRQQIKAARTAKIFLIFLSSLKFDNFHHPTIEINCQYFVEKVILF